jgi:hypothetical protein
MSELTRLHLDADTSMRALCQALIERGRDVTRTPTDWMPLDASDETQLLRATAQGRVIFTFNIRNFQQLAKIHPHHAGILLAAQSSWTLSALIAAVDKMLTETTAAQWQGQVYWLNQWRVKA